MKKTKSFTDEEIEQELKKTDDLIEELKRVTRKSISNLIKKLKDKKLINNLIKFFTLFLKLIFYKIINIKYIKITSIRIF